MAEKPAAEHHRREERFEHQGAPESLHRDHRLDGTAGRAAILFCEWQPEQAELGILRPQLAAPPLRGPRVAIALLEGVAVADQAIEALLEQPLLLAQIEIHSLRFLPAPTLTLTLTRLAALGE